MVPVETERMVTLKDIARHVGMAPSTVSAVLAGKSYCYVSAAKKEQILAAARELGLSYNRFIEGLRKAEVLVDRKILAELAVTDPAAFDAITVKAKKALP